MTKLSESEKKVVNAGAAASMGIATGIVAFTGIINLVMNLINRYWGGVFKSSQSSSEECVSSISSCWETHPELWHLPENQSNRITILSDTVKPS